MDRIRAYEKWMAFKKPFKKYHAFFVIVCFIKYQIVRKAQIGILKAVWSIRYRMKTRFPGRMSENDRALMQLRGIHQGETAFIIGNGPSLRADDLEALHERHVFCFAANRIHNIFGETNWRPDCYMTVDRSLCMNNDQTLSTILKESGRIRHYIFSKAMYLRLPEEQRSGQVAYFNLLPSDFQAKKDVFGESPMKYFSNGSTVTYVAMQLAAYMGFSRICLLGVDYSYANQWKKGRGIAHDSNIQTYFSDAYDPNNMSVGDMQGMHAAYETAARYAKEHGIQILNASRESRLEVFDRVDFDRFLEIDL